MSFITDYQIKPQQGATPKTIIIYGPPKKGKTTLACKIAEQVGVTICMNHENRLGHINESDILRHWPSRYESCDLNTAQSLLTYMRSRPDHGIQAIIMDTIDGLIEAEKRKKRLKTGKAIGFGEREIIHAQVLELLKDFKDLGCVIVITSHDKTDNTKQKVTLSLDKDFVVLVNKMCDYIFYLTEDGGNRKLITDSEFYETGASLNIEEGETLAREYTNPSWDVILPNLKPSEPTPQYVTKQQRSALKDIIADVEIIKALLKEHGYESSGQILQKDYDHVVSKFKEKVESEQVKNKKTEQNQCTPEDYKDLINKATTKQVLEAVRETLSNETQFSRDIKSELEVLIATKEMQLAA